jgi:hypothetical protein
MISVFQGTAPVPWLETHGLQPTAHVSHIVLDAEVAHDSDGDVVGMAVVLSLHARGRRRQARHVATTPSAYARWPIKVFAPTSIQPDDALAEIIDTALELINTTITADHTATLARAPHDHHHDRSGPAGGGERRTQIKHCSDCGRVTRIDDEPVDTDAADDWNGYCGSCADRREAPDSTDE